MQKVYQSIHGATEKRVRHLNEYANPGSHLLPVDKRGLHSSHYCTDQRITQNICNHIKSFPSQESHYARAKNQGKKCLSENLSIRKTYYLFLENYEPEQLERIKQGLQNSGKESNKVSSYLEK